MSLAADALHVFELGVHRIRPDI